jgi:hypothetical protein
VLESAFLYLAFALLALVLPGIGWQRALGRAVEPSLVLPLGIASCAGAYWCGLVTGSPWLGPLLLAAIVGAGAARGVGRLAEGPPLSAAVAPAIAVVALLAITQYRGNRVDAEGAFRLDPFVAADTAFHVGLTYELATAYPPQVPGVSGFPIGYHLGPDLVRAAAWRWARVRPYDQIARLDVTLGALLLVLLLGRVAHALGGTPRAVALAPFSLLATDFSFALAANPQAHWWADLLRGNLLVSLALSNPIVPALGLALAALVALCEHQRTGARAPLVLAAALAAALPFFKVFLGAHLLLGLGCAYLLRGRPLPLVVVAAPAAVATAALVLGQGGTTVDVALAPLDLVAASRATLGLAPLSGLALAAFAVAWVVASLGVRVVALPAAVRALREGPWAGTALAAMALAAWPLGLLFRVAAPEWLPGQTVVNDAAYFVEQGGALLWIFAALALGAWPDARARWAVPVCALLALPSTLQFAVKKARQADDPVPAARVRAVRAVEQVSAPGDVVLQRPGARYPPLPVVLAGRRVPYERFTPYLTQFLSRENAQRRHETVYRFFRTEDPGDAAAIVRELRARFVCLYGTDRVRFDLALLADPVHEEPDARCYRVRAD